MIFFKSTQLPIYLLKETNIVVNSTKLLREISSYDGSINASWVAEQAILKNWAAPGGGTVRGCKFWDARAE